VRKPEELHPLSWSLAYMEGNMPGASTLDREKSFARTGLDVIRAEVTVVEPDLVYLDASRLDRVSERGIEGPPTLVMKVL
jgi:hypothetical protein